MNATKYLSSQYMPTKEFPFFIKRYYHDSAKIPLPHSHEFIELIFVVQGNANHVFEGDCYPIKTNDVFIINPGEVHTFKIKPGDKLEIINCLFTSALLQDSLLKELGVSHSMDFFYIHPFLNKVERFHHFINADRNYSPRLLSILEGMIYEYNKGKLCNSTLVRLQLIELLILLSQLYNEMKTGSRDILGKEREGDILVQRIRGYLTRNYNRKITIPGLCKLFNVSPRHLSRLFKKETGQTVTEMIHSIRIEKAKALLLKSDYKVIEVAVSVGYDDPAFFSRLFRRSTGCSPGKYKEKEELRYSQINNQ
ncbi:helix-turn-helix domain-containing protein [Lederbergia ruris]|uniref:helix-turn-helix domain-containing protein n=1 Tax=Lederbergia ruris TaxID=217495 RepID=UPI0039A33195